MHIKKSKTIIATGIVAIGVIILSLLILWKYSIDAADRHLHEIEELRQATAFVDKMREIALHRTGLLNDMRLIDDLFDLDELQQELSFKGSDFMVNRDKFLTLNLSPEVKAIWQKAKSIVSKTGRAQTKVASLVVEDKRQEADKVMLDEAIPLQSKSQEQLSKILDVQQIKSELAMRQAQQNKEFTDLTIASIGTFALFLTIAIMIFVVRMARQTHKDLSRANEAKIANKMKSEFLAAMSHEIRTPLAAIIGYAEASLDSDQGIGDRLWGTRRIIHNGNHLLGLINNILDLSKIESGKFELEYMPISPIDIANEACNIVRIRAEEKQLKCEINYAFPLPKNIIGDSTRIKQILINLLSNAIKFTGKGHIYLKISYSQFEETISFEIEDTGIGISEEQQDKIFNAFVQADTSTTRKYGGTGLGLALTKDLIEKMDGELTIDSKPGVGSRFTITLGIGKPDRTELIYELDQIHSAHLDDIKTDLPMHRLQGKILLVEDNKDNQRILSAFMQKIGVDVTIADNGFKALEIFPNAEFDIIFMDMQMPIMDGPTATEKLREIGCTIPIIALTANAYKEDKERCLSAGCNDFITKPVTRNRLYETLSNYLDIAPEQQRDMSPIMSTLLEEDPEFADLVLDFIKTLPETMDFVQKALSNKNWDDMQSLLHNIKGSASSYGFPPLTETASQAEFQLLNSDYLKIKELTGELESLVERITAGNKLQAVKIHLAS